MNVLRTGRRVGSHSGSWRQGGSLSHQLLQTVKNLPAMLDTRVQSLGLEDLLEKEMALQYYCLENPIDRGAWWATVHGVTKIRYD